MKYYLFFILFFIGLVSCKTKKVTSPKGTTQSAIEFLESKDLKSIWQNALGAAIKRAEEISKN